MNTSTSPTPSPLMRASLPQWFLQSSPSRAPFWQQLLWTAGFSAAIAVGFTLLTFIMGAHTLSQWLSPRAWVVAYGDNLAVALVIGYITQGLYTAGRRIVGLARLATMKAWERTLFFAGIPLLGVALGWPIGMTLLFGDLRVLKSMNGADVLTVITVALMVTAMLSTFFTLRVRRIKAEMRANEAQLRLLQGQMEPHFLFNTLANVISLIDIDAPRAKSMLEAFTDYLRVSLGSLRRTESTVGAELDLATRFLQLMQTRMGERLRFEIDADAALRQAALPPLLLQPLIENAVKHGLEPQIDGGTVRVKAARVVIDGLDCLQLCVDDDGAGLDASAARPRRTVAGGPDGHGIAVANLRERLLAQFGPHASLTLGALAHAGGTRSCLVVPWQAAHGDAAQA